MSATPHESHGHSVAAWTAVTIIMLGAAVMCIAVTIAVPVLFWIGVGVVVLGPIAGKVLQAMGFGVSGKPGA